MLRVDLWKSRPGSRLNLGVGELRWLLPPKGGLWRQERQVERGLTIGCRQGRTKALSACLRQSLARVDAMLPLASCSQYPATPPAHHALSEGAAHFGAPHSGWPLARAISASLQFRTVGVLVRHQFFHLVAFANAGGGEIAYRDRALLSNLITLLR